MVSFTAKNARFYYVGFIKNTKFANLYIEIALRTLRKLLRALRLKRHSG